MNDEQFERTNVMLSLILEELREIHADMNALAWDHENTVDLRQGEDGIWDMTRADARA